MPHLLPTITHNHTLSTIIIHYADYKVNILFKIYYFFCSGKKKLVFSVFWGLYGGWVTVGYGGESIVPG
jgi:hypothetical protein